MAKSKLQRDPIPEEFKNIEEAAEFWDTHSLADYEDLQTDVEFEVELKSEKNYFAIEEELSDSIDKLAHLKGILPETLVNLWLKEKVLEKEQGFLRT
ncbi:BrnA antitoxin family protein [Dehalococcoidia bacterium]|nr:BrnA antitoxin family protein [Dehalococcoidia bacterium]MCL0070680.1 BrnA antitoxin family protein [Dehalococcoidia bacterium]MCL0078407.1 BrnA antitoxin family protein [Dehalococcoidia bacterium]MCL0095872.1 BrnA antitoxin family protein [Dehalococcoidia bacterium]